MLSLHLIFILLNKALLVLGNILRALFFLIVGGLIMVLVEKGESTGTLLLLHHLH